MQPELPIDPPAHWTDNLLGHYVIFNGEVMACESEREIDIIARLVRDLACDNLPSVEVFDRNGHVQGEIDHAGFSSMPHERDWDLVRKERIEESDYA
jgi:hypothetical protein